MENTGTIMLNKLVAGLSTTKQLSGQSEGGLDFNTKSGTDRIICDKTNLKIIVYSVKLTLQPQDIFSVYCKCYFTVKYY